VTWALGVVKAVVTGRPAVRTDASTQQPYVVVGGDGCLALSAVTGGASL